MRHKALRVVTGRIGYRGLAFFIRWVSLRSMKDIVQIRGFCGVCLAGCGFLRWQAGFRPGSRVTFFQQSQKKVTKKKASHVRALRVPCATRSVRDTCKLASLEMSTPLNRLRRFPLQRTTPAARQSRLRGVPGRGCASLASPERLVCCAHLAGVGLPHFSRLTSHKGTARRATTPDPLIPHPSLLIMGNHKGCPYGLTPHSSLLTPHPSKPAPCFG